MLSFKFSYTKFHQKGLQNSQVLHFLGKKNWKSETFYKKPKFCIVFTKFLLFLKFLIFEFLGHFWLIFSGQFSFFGILGVKKSKTEKFYKLWKNLLLKTKKSYLKKNQFLNFGPPKCQKTKIGPRKSAKNDPKIWKSKISRKVKILWKLSKILAFNEIFLIFNPSCPKSAKTVNFRVIFGEI